MCCRGCLRRSRRALPLDSIRAAVSGSACRWYAGSSSVTAGAARGGVEAGGGGVGRGRDFSVPLPLGASDPQVQPLTGPAPADAPFRRQKVLVVDDNRDAADSCAALLELSGHEVQTAYNAH